MANEIEEYLNVLNELRDQVKNQIDGLPQEELDWRPIDAGGELSTNSLGVIAAHVAGSEHFWIREIIGGQNINRDRASEFTTRGIGFSELQERLSAAGLISTEVLSAMDEAQLNEDRKWQDQTVSVRWCILHVIDHTAQHLGHMQLTRQLLKVR